jgi:hypothetical protein
MRRALLGGWFAISSFRFLWRATPLANIIRECLDPLEDVVDLFGVMRVRKGAIS